MNKGQVMITFDDCTYDQLYAAIRMNSRDLVGVFGAVTSKIDTPGFMPKDQLIEMKDKHFICNHSATHIWSGGGQPKESLKEYSAKELTSDYEEGQKWLNDADMHGDYLMVPFGTTNVLGEEHLAKLSESFKWIRMTIGAPMPDENGMWTPTGGKRLYPHNYSNKVIGISAAADMRHPNDVKEKIDNAVSLGCLCVLVYHRIGHVVGNAMDITWERFTQDIDLISGLVEEDKLECVTPDMLVKET